MGSKRFRARTHAEYSGDANVPTTPLQLLFCCLLLKVGHWCTSHNASITMHMADIDCQDNVVSCTPGSSKVSNMSLRQTLTQSIAALERIAALDPEHTSNYVPLPHDSKEPIYVYYSSSPSYIPRDEKQGLHEKRTALDPPGMDEMDAKTTHRLAVGLRAASLVGLPLLILAIAATIVGLAADNLAFVSPQLIVEAYQMWVDSPTDGLQLYNTRMYYWPDDLDTQSFIAVIAAGAICTLGGLVVGPLSIIHWRSKGRAVALSTQKHQTSHRAVLLACLILDAAMFIAAFSVLVFARDLFMTEGRYSLFGNGALDTQHFRPSLPPPQHSDDVVRKYLGRIYPKANPLNWNCRFDGSISSPDAHERIFHLCGEAIAARTLLAILVAFQGLLLTVHGFAWWGERKGDGMPWTAQKLGSEERIITAAGEEGN